METFSMEYNYDFQNRMISAETAKQSKNHQVSYSYDGLGRRVNRRENIYQTSNGNLQETLDYTYYYKGSGFTMAHRSYINQNHQTELQSYYQGAAGLLAFSGGNGSNTMHYAYTDYQGTLQGYTDDNNLRDKYLYDAFGTPILGSFDGVNTLGYNGKVYDEVTGLHNYGYRDYQTDYSGFTTVDPIRDGSDWYAYCSNNPVNYVDPTGLLQVEGTTAGPDAVYDAWDTHTLMTEPESIRETKFVNDLVSLDYRTEDFSGVEYEELSLTLALGPIGVNVSYGSASEVFENETIKSQNYITVSGVVTLDMGVSFNATYGELPDGTLENFNGVSTSSGIGIAAPLAGPVAIGFGSNVVIPNDNSNLHGSENSLYIGASIVPFLDITASSLGKTTPVGSKDYKQETK